MILNAAIVSLALLIVVVFIYKFYHQAGTIWQRSIGATRDSMTILWARFQIVAVAAIGGLASVAQFFNEPTVATAIQTYLSPKVVAVIMVTCAIITEYARRRTLAKDSTQSDHRQYSQ